MHLRNCSCSAESKGKGILCGSTTGELIAKKTRKTLQPMLKFLNRRCIGSTSIEKSDLGCYGVGGLPVALDFSL
jgi:hypothetical protein